METKKYKELIKQIEELSIDKSFNILTRNALEYKILNLNSQFNAVFIDINNLKQLNKLLGYGEVNNIIKKTFDTFKFKDTDIVGRWFSGDEILIICVGNPYTLYKQLKRHFYNNNLSFKNKIFYNVKSLYDLELLINIIKQ